MTTPLPGNTQAGGPALLVDQVENEGPQQVDYFGFSADSNLYYLPDGVSYIELKKLNGGGRSAYEKATRGDIILERGSGNARLQVDPARDRNALLKQAIVGWNLKRGGQPVPFNNRNLDDFVELTDPTVVDKIHEAARKLNKWLESEMTVEDIDIEIERLETLREETKERERGEASSGSK